MLTPPRFGKGGIKLEKDIRDRIAPPYKDNAYSTCFANTTYIANTACTVAYMPHIPSYRVPRKKFLIISMRSRGTFK